MTCYGKYICFQFFYYNTIFDFLVSKEQFRMLYNIIILCSLQREWTFNIEY